MKLRCVRSCLLLVTLLHCCAHQSLAQAVDDVGIWNAAFAQGDFDVARFKSDKLKWWFDGHLRFLDDTGGFHQSIVRPGIGWALTERSALWAGYGWIRTSTLSGLEIDEHRIWQQWTASKKTEVWKVALRSRFEQRLVETGNDTGLRFRQFFRLQHNLPEFPRLTLVGWDELFYNLNDTDWGAQSGFNQNRVFAGIGYKPSQHARWRVEVDYLNQVVEVPFGSDRNNHILAFNFFRRP